LEDLKYIIASVSELHLEIW